MTTTPGKLTVGKDGKLTGPATITYNDPWPCVNHGDGSGAMRGVIMHTMVGNLPGTIVEFNDALKQVSAFFGIDQAGHIHQFMEVGKGRIAWAQVAGNEEWYSIEHADDKNPDNPLTAAQITASAQLVECLSAFAGFPLRVTNSVTGHGYGTHSMGGAAWGGHTCPDLPPRHVRSLQRADIITLAKEIRAGVKPPLPSGIYHADGKTALAALAHRQGVNVAAIWWETAVTGHVTGSRADFGKLQAAYLNAVKWDALMPSGMILWLP